MKNMHTDDQLLGILEHRYSILESRKQYIEEEMRLLIKGIEALKSSLANTDLEEEKQDEILGFENIDYGETFSDRKEYDDPRWLAKRITILNRDSYKCQICSPYKNIRATEVHHINYKAELGGYINHIWESPDQNLVSLCHECHSKFIGKKSHEVIFVITNDRPFPITGDYLYQRGLYDYEEYTNPIWEEVEPELQGYSLRKDEYGGKALIFAILAPEYSILGKQLLLEEELGTTNEIQKFCKLNQFRHHRHIKMFIDGLIRLSERCPSTKINCDYVIPYLRRLEIDCCSKPNKGIIVGATRNKRKGYYISIYDLDKKKEIKRIDYSKIPEYKSPNNKDQNPLAILHGVKYAMDYCKENNINPIDYPIYTNDPNGIGALYSLKYKEDLIEMTKETDAQGIKKLIIEILKTIDLSLNYNINLEWDTDNWGENPIKGI